MDQNNQYIIPADQLPADRIIFKTVNTKPISAIIVVLIAGVIFIYAGAAIKTTGLLVLGIIMAVLSLFGIFGVRTKPQVEICDDILVVYAGPSCAVFRWNDIAEWGVRSEASQNVLTVRTKDGTVTPIVVYNAQAVYNAIFKRLPDCESARLYQKKINEKRENSPSFKQSVKNFFARWRKKK
jgi:hypothetical protein